MLNPPSVLVRFAGGVGGTWELTLGLLMFLAVTRGWVSSVHGVTRGWVSSVHGVTRDWNAPIVMPL